MNGDKETMMLVIGHYGFGSLHIITFYITCAGNIEYLRNEIGRRRRRYCQQFD